MKNLVFGIIATVLFGIVGNAQTTSNDWKSMMSSYDSSVNKVLLRECPQNMRIEDFKIAIVNGTVQLSQTGQKEVLELTEPIKLYSQEFKKKHHIQTTNDAEMIFLAGLSPALPIINGQLEIGNVDESLTWAEVGNCAIAAVGVNVLWSLMASGASTWSVGAISAAFSRVAARIVGPIGVAITIAAFGWCLADQYAD